MKRTVCILLTALMIMGALAGCQKTPESPMVIGKNTENLIKSATTQTTDHATSEGQLMKQLAVPERFLINDTYLDGKLTIHADAPIDIPDAAQMPVVRVAPADFTQELVSKLYTELIGETPMFENLHLWSKQQIEQELLVLRKEIAAAPPNKAELEKQIAELEARYDSASDSSASLPANSEMGTYTQYDARTGMAIDTLFGLDITSNPGIGDTSRSTAITLQVINNKAGNDITVDKSTDGSGVAITDNASRGARLYYQNPNASVGDFSIVAPVDDANFTEQQASLAGIRPIDAVETVNALLQIIGATDMTPDRMEIAYIISEADFTRKEELSAKEKAKLADEMATGTCAITPLGAQFIVYCNRTVSNAVVMNGNLSSYVGDAMYGKQWFYESCKITVSAQGISDISWVSPHIIVETVTDNSNLLPFTAIQDIFQKMFRVVYEAESDAKRKFDVSQVRLALRRVMEQNSVENGLFVPVWDFYGQAIYQYESGFEAPATVFGETRPILTINAIDGSIIDLDKGY